MLNFIFPVRPLHNLSKRNRTLTFVVFFLYILFPIVTGRTQNPPKDFFPPSSSVMWKILFSYVGFLYSSIGHGICIFISYLVRFGTIFVLGRSSRDTRFLTFILPFLSFAYIGILLRMLDFLPFIKVYGIPFGYIVTVYLLSFYVAVLVRENELKLLESILIVLIALVVEQLVAFIVFMAPVLYSGVFQA